MRRYARAWARGLSTKDLAAAIPHCRVLRDCFMITHRYDAYYAALIGIYRAELARRSREG